MSDPITPDTVRDMLKAARFDLPPLASPPDDWAAAVDARAALRGDARFLARAYLAVCEERDRLARVLAVEGGDESAADPGWVVGDPGHWRRGNLRVSRDGASGLYLFRLVGQDADPRRFKFALEAMEAADAAGGSDV